MIHLRFFLIFLMCLTQSYTQRCSNINIYLENNYKLYNDSINNMYYILFKEDINKHGWDSPLVNCYKDINIPLTAKIDVSEFTMPINDSVIITSNYGYRSQFGRIHYGVDLRLKTGDTVRATFNGVIRIVNYEKDGYGKYIVIRHNNGIETVYAHLSKHLVNRNQVVNAGEAIGLGGNSGRSTNSHLHYEIRYFGLSLNPSSIVDFKKGVILQDVYIFDKNKL